MPYPQAHKCYHQRFHKPTWLIRRGLYGLGRNLGHLSYVSLLGATLSISSYAYGDIPTNPPPTNVEDYWVITQDNSPPYACYGSYQLPKPYANIPQYNKALPLQQQPLYALANSSTQTKNSLHLTGNVEVFKAGKVLTSDQVMLYQEEQTHAASEADNSDKNTDAESQFKTGTASGNVTLRDDTFVLLGSQATFNENLNNAQMDDAQLIDTTSELRTQADTIQWHADETMSVVDGQFTFCPPGDNSWHIDASNINVYPDKGYAEVTHATLKIGQVPIFYLPWLSIPIDDKRRSGFLFPQASFTSQDGLHIATPYYANLAPNYDAIITPHIRQKRGNSVTVAARHLSHVGYSRINLLTAPQDKITNNQRWYANYQFKGNISPRLFLDADIARASDITIFADYDYKVTHADEYKVASRWQFTYQYPSVWLQSIRFGSKFYQQLTDATPSYNQRAYITLTGADTIASTTTYASTFNLLGVASKSTSQQKVSYQLDWQDFTRDNQDLTDLAKINGQRLHFTPQWQQQWRTDFGYLNTRIGLPLTHYQLQDHPSTAQANYQRHLYQLELDTGLWFDRPYKGSNDTANLGNQTLEPRLYWTYTPFQDQADLPVFDTSAVSKPLYQPNRFSGADRIGDSHRITLALTSRVTNHQGIQKAKFSLAQIHYLQDRKVQLPGIATQTEPYSPIYGGIDYRVNSKLSTQLHLDWQPNTSKISTVTASAKYQSGQDQYFHLDYTQTTDTNEQIKATVIWPLGGNWTGFVHSTTNLMTNNAISQAIGLEYIDCCWDLRIVNHDWVDSASTDNKHAIYFEMSLKGIDNGATALSNKISDRLARFTRNLTKVQ